MKWIYSKYIKRIYYGVTPSLIFERELAMSAISQISPTNLSKYISPIRTAIEVLRESDGNKFKIDAKPMLKIDAEHNLKGNKVDTKV